MRLCCERSHLPVLIRDSAISLLFVIPILGLAGLSSTEDLRYHIFFLFEKNFFPLGLANMRSTLIREIALINLIDELGD
jgi:hypothetical protein